MNDKLGACSRVRIQPRWFYGVCLFVLTMTALAEEPIIVTSFSKQFVVRGLPQRSLLAAKGKPEMVYVDPSLLVVTCDSVRRTLDQELGWGRRWQGHVYINVHPIRFDNEPMNIRARRMSDKWNYYVEMPDEVRRRELLEAIVALSLVEFADRAAREKSVELPPWLVEGLTAHLMQGPLAGAAMHAHTLKAIADDPELVAPRTVRHADVDQALRRIVQNHGALTFDQLNWPEFADDDRAAADAYRHSAHLFVRELLRLRGGPDALCAMLAMLPEHLNWQTAFLRGFEAHFARMLDVEKWWSLTVARTRTRDNSLTWSAVAAQAQLEEILQTSVPVRSVPGAAPNIVPVTLQTVINDWDFEQQVAVLQRKMVQLQAARVRLPAELSALAAAYHASIEKYLRARGAAWFDFTAREAAARAAAEFDALDTRRQQLAGNILTAAGRPSVPPPVD